MNLSEKPSLSEDVPHRLSLGCAQIQQGRTLRSAVIPQEVQSCLEARNAEAAGHSRLFPCSGLVQRKDAGGLLRRHVGESKDAAHRAQAQAGEEESACPGQHLEARRGETHEVRLRRRWIAVSGQRGDGRLSLPCVLLAEMTKGFWRAPIRETSLCIRIYAANREVLDPQGRRRATPNGGRDRLQRHPSKDRRGRKRPTHR